VLTHWTGTEVRKVRKRDAIDAVVIARHRQDDGKVLKVRWWVSRESGAWKVYDFELLDVGLRYGALVAAAGRSDEAAADLQAAAEARQDGAAAIKRRDADGTAKATARLEGLRLPRMHDAMRHLFLATAAVQRGEYREGLDDLDRAVMLHPDLPTADLLRAL